MDDTKLVGLVTAFNEAFNAGDLDKCAEFFAENITVINGDQHTASNRADFIAAAKAGQAAGWIGQRLISAAAKNNTIALLYENLFADGSTTTGAGGILIDDTGRICQIRTVNGAGTPLQA
ncbi:MAG: nuclear transport factor 2 family protein [Acidimicrobiia bacterium]|nr:nuclear transport factor 2 family protein [Acidimicrobiia bacterium]MDH5294700.1 nuclear transport factor 2 family protein [Acidimicrobiia bacterium]